MLVFASHNHRLHDALELSRGQLQPSIESPRRADIISQALATAGHQLSAPGKLDLALVRRIHTPEYIEFLASAWTRWQDKYGDNSPAMAFAWPSRNVSPKSPKDLVGQLGYHSFAADCSIVDGTWQAAAEAAAIAQSAAEQVIQSGTASYALCRPPGHHATSDQFGGYCFLNNSAIAAQRLLDSGVERVAILDIDYHHGNGTQDIFYQRSDVFTISIHADPVLEFPWFTGHACELGQAQGRDWNLNIPLQPGANYPAWLAAIEVALERITTSEAQALVIAFGTDTFTDDPLGTFTIGTNDYTKIAQRIEALKLPTVIVQEGGYAVEAIGDNVVAFLQAFD